MRDVSVFWRKWETSDQRKLEVECPHCGHPQELRWGSDKTRYGFKYEVYKNGHVIYGGLEGADFNAILQSTMVEDELEKLDDSGASDPGSIMSAG